MGGERHLVVAGQERAGLEDQSDADRAHLRMESMCRKNNDKVISDGLVVGGPYCNFIMEKL